MKYVIAEQYQHYADFISQLPERLHRGEGEVIYSQRNEVRRLEHQDRVFIVKLYKKVNAIQQVVYTFFRKTKAARAYLYAQEFRRRGIDTPREIAYIETRSHGLFTTGYFVSEECLWREAALDLRERQDFDRELGRSVMQHTVTMHSRGVLHGDLNLTNFLYQKSTDSDTDDGAASGDSPYHFKMIDTNRSRFTDGWPSDDECLKNLVRLTHRRDLYEYLIRQYADLRGWNQSATAGKALSLLDRFEQRKFHL
jgi:tRNA A-37 threonylcarbamoyl transferase component Bud32